MKLIRKERDSKDRDILVCESRFLFWKWICKFLATNEFPTGYWEWLQLPDKKKIYSNYLSFQLDAWNREEN